MLTVDIRRPKTEDCEQLYEFFRTMVTDTFAKEGIGDQLNDIKEENEVKNKHVHSDLESNELFFISSFSSGLVYSAGL